MEAETSDQAWGQGQDNKVCDLEPQPRVLVSHFCDLLAPSPPSPFSPIPDKAIRDFPEPPSPVKPRSLRSWLGLLTATDFATWLQLFQSLTS